MVGPEDSNLQPDRYERSALTIELQALRFRLQSLSAWSATWRQLRRQKRATETMSVGTRDPRSGQALRAVPRLPPRRRQVGQG